MTNRDPLFSRFAIAPALLAALFLLPPDHARAQTNDSAAPADEETVSPDETAPPDETKKKRRQRRNAGEGEESGAAAPDAPDTPPSAAESPPPAAEKTPAATERKPRRTPPAETAEPATPPAGDTPADVKTAPPPSNAAAPPEEAAPKVQEKAPASTERTFRKKPAAETAEPVTPPAAAPAPPAQTQAKPPAPANAKVAPQDPVPPAAADAEGEADQPATRQRRPRKEIARPGNLPSNMQELRRQRRSIVNKRLDSVVIKEPDNRTIVKKGNRAIIIHNEANRIQRVAPSAEVQKQTDGSSVTVIKRPNNITIYNVSDRDGQLVRRYRRDAAGHETDIIDNRRRKKKSRFGRNLAIGLGVGVGVVAGAALLNSMVDVPPPRVGVPRRKYIVDYEGAGEDDVYEAFNAPPVDRIERRYTLDEVRATSRLRDHMRRVDLNDINFETGSWDVEESQYHKLERVARAMRRVIRRNPSEVFLIEGYTDAVGTEEDNLTLSDRRAESVAVILSEQFDVPPENLTTQGYGEQYLKVSTLSSERANRRVAVRRITPLISQAGPRGGYDNGRDDDGRYGNRDDEYDDRSDDHRYERR